MAEALYNKYRPQVFEDVVGQEHIERTLKNAIASDKISHAYLFTGPRGTGKTTTARLLAKALLCESGPTPEPDGTCEDCELVARGEHPDVYELDAASRTGVENVREEIIGKVNYAPTRGRYKIYIIDEVHMLSTAAFNALLKTLEEPPSHVIFVLATTDPQKVPETILSRCQRFDFRRIGNDELVSRLGAICEMENVPFDGDALELIAHRAQGGMRDALTSLEQMIAFGEGEIDIETAERLLGSVDSSELSEIVLAIGKRDAAACFKWTAEYMETGADLVQISNDLTTHMRNMYVMSLSGDTTALDLTDSQRRELEAESEWFGPDRISRMLGVLGELLGELKTSTNQRLSFEVALTKLIRPDSEVTLEALFERIEALERAIASGNLPAAAATSEAVTVGSVADDARAKSRTTDAATQSSVKPVSKPDSEPEDMCSDEKLEAVTSSDGTSRDIAKIWRSVAAFLKKKPGAYSTLFMEVKVFDDDGKMVISFAPKSNIVFRAANKPETKAVLEEALAAAGVPGMPYELVQGRGFGDDAGASANSVARNEQPQQATTDPGSATAAASPESTVQQEEASEAEVAIGQNDETTVAQAEPSPKEDVPLDDTGADNDAQAMDEADSIAQLVNSAFGEGAVIEEID